MRYHIQSLGYLLSCSLRHNIDIHLLLHQQESTLKTFLLGGVWSWGYNNAGELGYLPTQALKAEGRTPVKVDTSSVGPIAYIAAGYHEFFFDDHCLCCPFRTVLLFFLVSSTQFSWNLSILDNFVFTSPTFVGIQESIIHSKFSRISLLLLGTWYLSTSTDLFHYDPVVLFEILCNH
jgi:hypothetical protein